MSPETQIVDTKDGVRIAYDVTGDGPPLFLLHGGGLSRRDWYRVGYVERLQHEFTLVTIDFRGFGESDKPRHPQDYAVETQCEDVIAVANAAGIGDFAIWGYSYGGNISRYLAQWYKRVKAIAVIGVPFGPAVHDYFAGDLEAAAEKWLPLVEAYHTGHRDQLSDREQQVVASGEIEAFLGWSRAMKDWPEVDPGDAQCPTLLMVGEKNEGVMEWVRLHQDQLDSAHTQVEIMPGLDHADEFRQIDAVFPILYDFFKANATG